MPPNPLGLSASALQLFFPCVYSGLKYNKSAITSCRTTFTFTFTTLQAFPLCKAYMLGFGQVRKGS